MYRGATAHSSSWIAPVPWWGESLRVYGHVDFAILSWGRCGGWRVVKPVGGEGRLFLFFVVSGIRGLEMGEGEGFEIILFGLLFDSGIG